VITYSGINGEGPLPGVVSLGEHDVDPVGALYSTYRADPPYPWSGLGIHAVEPSAAAPPYGGLGIHAVEPSAAAPPYGGLGIYRIAPGNPILPAGGLGEEVIEPGYVVPGSEHPEDYPDMFGLGQNDTAVEVLRQFVEVERGQAKSLRTIAVWTAIMGGLTVAAVTASVLVGVMAAPKLREREA
jgi:hypothetical protein